MIRAAAIVALTLAVGGCADDLNDYAAKVAADHERNRERAAATCKRMQAQAIADGSSAELEDANSCWRTARAAEDIWNDMQARQRQNAAAAAAMSGSDWAPPPQPYAPLTVGNTVPMPSMPPVPQADPPPPVWQPPRSTQVIHCVGVIRIDPGAPPGGCE